MFTGHEIHEISAHVSHQFGWQQLLLQSEFEQFFLKNVDFVHKLSARVSLLSLAELMTNIVVN